MKNIFLLNAHQEYPFSPGRLNASLIERAEKYLSKAGYEVKKTFMKDNWEVEAELEKHQWADAVILQTPVNWMGVPWSFKKYMDEVYTAGMGGQLCNGDGRTRKDPSKQYGSGGALEGKKYMLSLTFNAPPDSFGNSDQYLFGEKTEDDLFFPMHMNFRFFAMEALPTFVCYDVMKNPKIEEDFLRLEAHLKAHFPQV